MTGALFGAPFFICYFAENIFLKAIRSKIVFSIAWLLLMTVLLCIPGTRLPKINWSSKIFLDKWIHVFLFLVLIILWCRAILRKTKNRFLIITLLGIMYGIVMEIVQHFFIPFRSFDYADMVANSIGAIAGCFISVKRFIGKS